MDVKGVVQVAGAEQLHLGSDLSGLECWDFGSELLLIWGQNTRQKQVTKLFTLYEG